jgi:hypothetical protein
MCCNFPPPQAGADQDGQQGAVPAALAGAGVRGGQQPLAVAHFPQGKKG